MQEEKADIIIAGNTPLAALLAGLLASIHGRKVVLYGDIDWTYRLPTGIDLSVAPVTRPDSWAMLAQAGPEATRLLGRIGGKGALYRIDPVFSADTSAGADALSHMRHVASEFGFAVEKFNQAAVSTEIGHAYRLRDAIALSRPRLAQPIQHWLDQNKVQTISPRGSQAIIMSAGAASIALRDRIVEAPMSVLADDAAILAHLPENAWSVLRRSAATAYLTEPTAPMISRAMIHIDRQVELYQAENGSVTLVAEGSGPDAHRRVGAALAGHGPIRAAGEREMEIVRSADGAPFIGSSKDSGIFVLADLGPTGVFLAPALARFIAGTAGQAEQAYFAARGTREAQNSGVGEYRFRGAAQ